MCLPCARDNFHLRKHRCERRFFRRTGIYAERDVVASFEHMADSHLTEINAVAGALDAVIIPTPGESVPHGFNIGGDGRSCPVGITVVSCNAAKMLKGLIFEFNGALQPVLAIKIHDYAALIKTLVALCKVGLYDKTEKLLPGAYLQDRRIVIPEMVICPLPEVCVRRRFDTECVVAEFKGIRLPCPYKGF